MRTKLTVATALAGTLLATGLISASAQATSFPVLKGDAPPSVVALVGHGGGGGHGGGHGGGNGGNFAARSSGGHGDHHGRMNVYGRSFSHGNYGGRYYAYSGGRNYAYSGGKHGGHGHYPYGRYASHYRHNRYYGWYYPNFSYGYYGGGCGWLYRNALATGSPYWWNRYYECTGYY